MIPGKQYKPEDFVRAAWRRRWMLIVPMILFAVATGVWSLSQPDEYRSETTLLIVPPSGANSFMNGTEVVPIEDRLYTIRQQTLSHDRLQSVIESLNLYQDWRQVHPQRDAVDRMRSDIDIEIVKGNPRRVDGNFFTISFVSQEPETAAAVTNSLADLFVNENARDQEGAARMATEFIQAQLGEARAKLDVQERRLEVYRQSNAAALPERLLSNLDQIRRQEGQLQTLEDSLSADRGRRLALEGLIAGAEVQLSQGTFRPTPRTTAAAAGASVGVQLEVAREELRALQLRMTAEHPDVIRARRMVGELEDRARAEGVPESPDGRALSPAEVERQQRLQELRGELASLDRQIADKERTLPRIRETMAVYQARVDAAPAHEAQLAALTRDLQTLEGVYQRLLAGRENALISAKLEAEQGSDRFRVIEPAQVPANPFRPDRVRWSFLGALFGLGLGVGLVALIEYRDSSLRTDSDVVTALGLPVLAMIPVMRTTSQVTGQRWVKAAVSLLVVMASVIALMWTLNV